MMKTTTLRLIAILVLFGVFEAEALAQTGRIAGKIVDHSSAEPLIGASLLVVGTSIGAAADLDGNFSVGGVRAGEQELVISYMGYETIRMTVTIVAGQTLILNIQMHWQGVVGEEVYITAQARGQLSAINQQLASNTITNIVSSDRIREVPDVNAAESIGRLPGVSLQRSGGEANKVVIRGLSPKYNVISVNGVRVPSTDSQDRSVDLSLIASNMLDGIEVMKAITPDKDADALGGTVDLRLREAPEGLSVDLTTQGGYNRVQSYYGNYKIAGSVSNRFLDSKLGVIANFSFDSYDRSADKFNGDYRRFDLTDGTITTRPFYLRLREENVDRSRSGANLLTDYRLPNGKITGNVFFNQLQWDGVFRNNIMDFSQASQPRHHYQFETRGGTTSMMTSSFGVEQDFGWIKYDITLSNTFTKSENPNERTWLFTREGGSYTDNVEIRPGDSADTFLQYTVNDSTGIRINDLYSYDSSRREDQQTIQFNFQVPLQISRNISGYVKTGAKFRWLSRENDQEQYGRNGLYYSNDSPLLATLDQALPEWGVAEQVSMYGGLPLSFFLSEKRRNDFLNGRYPLGLIAREGMLNTMSSALEESGEFRRVAIGSRGFDYDGIERQQAGYLMGEVNFWKYLTILGGFRYEYDYTRYNGQSFRSATNNNVETEPNDLTDLTSIRKNDFFLPMLHLNVSPTDWLKIRLARTESLVRPDYYQYTPITFMNQYSSYIRAANSQLKPAHAINYDAAISIFQHHVGLFTVAGFHKEISDLIFQYNLPLNQYIDNKDYIPEGLNIPPSWLVTSTGAPRTISSGADTFLNNDKPAYVYGLEFDWQTNFWYLPSFLKGIVFNINYTRIWSEMTRTRYYDVATDRRIGTRFPPVYYREVVSESRKTRIVDQPSAIMNVTLGYDLKGFSMRLSYLFSSDNVTALSNYPQLDSFTGDFYRWDFAMRQKLSYGLEIFGNFNNLTNREDRSYRGSDLVNPTYIEYYGFTMDIGIRYRF